MAEVRLDVSEDTEDTRTLLDNLTSSWRKHGQALGREFPCAFVDSSYRVIVMMPLADSLEEEHDSRYVQLSKADIIKVGLAFPTATLLGKDPFGAEPCSCSRPSYFILYTDYASLESCLRCGDCFGPVPLYRIPYQLNDKGELHDQIITWESDYQACDTLQMNCSTGEAFGLRELCHADSSLSKRGRKLSSNVGLATGTPTYSFLFRYRGRSLNSEKKRLCPSCGGGWLLEEQLHGTFDFKCDRCHLLSNIAISMP